MRRAAAVLALAVLAGPAPRAVAQLAFGAQVTGLITRAAVPGDSSLTEARIIAPLAFASAATAGGRLTLHAMLDAEGWTMRSGELSPGAWGEGFYDRRHPHTFFHELIASATDLTSLPGGVHWSLAAGKGFAPFGSDDPMNRPALLYPVNHHWAQVLERAVAVGGLRRGPVTIEAGVFDGDEPERYSEWPNWSRFGDSWSARALVHPTSQLELQGSFAHVVSPEDRAGAGPTNSKVSLSARLERPLGPGTLYALAEWTSNSESNGFFVFHSALAEAEFRHGGHRHYARLERADRPEDQRDFGDPFRSPRPPTDNSLIGVTTWTTVTGGSAFALPQPARAPRAEAIIEVAWSQVSAREGVFDPGSFYGRTGLWSVTAGLRLSAGMAMHRMGRYGVAAPDAGMAGMAMPGMGRP